MSLAFGWFLPTTGDGRPIAGRGHSPPLTCGLGETGGRPPPGAAASRAPDTGYLAQAAQAAGRMGFEAVLTPAGTWCEDAWPAPR